MLTLDPETERQIRQTLGNLDILLQALTNLVTVLSTKVQADNT